jgi:hypothetical protein
MLLTYTGRIQLRLFLLVTVGVPVSICYGFFIGDTVTPNIIIFTVTIGGIMLDSLYDYIQSLTWDKDWPPLYIFVTGVIEFMFILMFISVSKNILFFVFPFSLFIDANYSIVIIHYWLAWITIFFTVTVIIPILFPGAKFNGGKIFYRLNSA